MPRHCRSSECNRRVRREWALHGLAQMQLTASCPAAPLSGHGGRAEASAPAPHTSAMAPHVTHETTPAFARPAPLVADAGTRPWHALAGCLPAHLSARRVQFLVFCPFVARGGPAA